MRSRESGAGFSNWLECFSCREVIPLISGLVGKKLASVRFRPNQFSANAPDQVEEEVETEITTQHNNSSSFTQTTSTTTIVRLSTLQTGFLFSSLRRFSYARLLCYFQFRNGWRGGEPFEKSERKSAGLVFLAETFRVLLSIMSE